MADRVLPDGRGAGIPQTFVDNNDGSWSLLIRARQALPSTLYVGEATVDTGDVAVPLATESTPLYGGIVSVKALTSNTATVYVGPSGVTTSSGYPLDAGEEVVLYVDDLNAVYVVSASTGQSVRYLAS